MTTLGEDASERAAREATAWFVRLNDRSATDVDRRAFDAWLQADPAHGEAFDEVEGLWKTLDAPAAALGASGWHGRVERPRPARWATRGMTFALAATAVAAAVLWRDPGLVARAMADHATRPGERIEVSLADGTKLFLDGDSAVDEDIAANERRVTILRGRVWFDVAKDAARPFAVHADALDLRVLGTTFGVDRDDSLVTVDHGAVTVSAGGEHLRLTGGQQVSAATGRLAAPEHVEPDAALAWRRGLIVFDAAPLGDVIRELNRMSAGRVIAPQSEVRALRLSGVFRVDDPRGLVEAIRSGLALKTLEAAGVATVIYR